MSSTPEPAPDSTKSETDAPAKSTEGQSEGGNDDSDSSHSSLESPRPQEGKETEITANLTEGAPEALEQFKFAPTVPA
jgi:hypothetical protein